MRAHLSSCARLAAIAFLVLFASARAPPPARALSLVRAGEGQRAEEKVGWSTAWGLLGRRGALSRREEGNNYQSASKSFASDRELNWEGEEEAWLSIREVDMTEPPESDSPAESPSSSPSSSPSMSSSPTPSATPTPTASPALPPPAPSPMPSQTVAVSASPSPSEMDEEDDDDNGGEQGDDDKDPDRSPVNGASSGSQGQVLDDGDDPEGGLAAGAIGAIAAAAGVVFLVIVAAVIIGIRRRAHSRSGDGSYYNFNEGAATPMAPSGSDIGPDAGTTVLARGLGPESDSKPSGGTGTTSGGTLGSPITTASTPINPASQESIIPGDSVSQREAPHPGAAAHPGVNKPELVPVPIDPSGGGIRDRPVEPSAPTASKFTRIDSGVSSTSDDTIVAPQLGSNNPPQQTPSSIAPWFVEGGGE